MELNLSVSQFDKLYQWYFLDLYKKNENSYFCVNYSANDQFFVSDMNGQIQDFLSPRLGQLATSIPTFCHVILMSILRHYIQNMMHYVEVTNGQKNSGYDTCLLLFTLCRSCIRQNKNKNICQFFHVQVQQRAMLKTELGAHHIYIHMLSCLNKWR